MDANERLRAEQACFYVRDELEKLHAIALELTDCLKPTEERKPHTSPFPMAWRLAEVIESRVGDEEFHKHLEFILGRENP